MDQGPHQTGERMEKAGKMTADRVNRVNRGVNRRGHRQTIDSVIEYPLVNRVNRINPKRVTWKSIKIAAEAGGIGNRLWALHRDSRFTGFTRFTTVHLWACIRAFGKADRVDYRAFPELGSSPAVGLRGARSPGISPPTQKIEIPKFGFPSGIRFTDGFDA